MRISKPKITSENNKRMYQVEVESTEGKETLWYSVEDKFGELLTEASDAPVVALLIPAMLKGEDIHIEGIISDRLYHNLSKSLQSVLQQIIPSLNQIKIYPKEVRSGGAKIASGVATGFSGGIDSYCALADYHYSDIPERFKVTHLLFNNVGSHGRGGERLFEERFKKLLTTTEKIGLPFVKVNSNLHSFYDDVQLRFGLTHTLRNVSVGLLLQRGIGRYMYASAYQYSDVFIGPTKSMGHSDLVTLPMLSTETLDAFSIGSEYSRVQKTLRVAELPDSYGTLDVCVNDHNLSGHTNCSRCWKCLRTLSTLEIAGEEYLERYCDSFDLNIYMSEKKSYLGRLLGSDDPLAREIVKFAYVKNYSFPISSHLRYYSELFPITRLARYGLSKLMQLAKMT